MYVLGLSPISDIIKKLKIGFLNSLFHVKQSGQCLETLKLDYKIENAGGLIEEVKSYCEEYGLPDVSEVYVHPTVIKDKIERVVLDRQWLNDLKAKKPPISIRRSDRSQKFYTSMAKNQAKLMLCHEVGELNFRRNRRQEALKKYGSVECLIPFCKEEDSLSHVQNCKGYSSKLKEGASPYEFIDYLVELEAERNKKFNRSLINFKTL